jgi:hypothetical protein
MKKYILILSITFAGSLLLSSCNKKLKDDVSALDSQVKALQAQNAALLGQSEELQNATNNYTSEFIGEPMHVTTTFFGDTDSLWTVSGSYKVIGGSAYDFGRMIEYNNDSIFNIYIERYGDMNGNNFGCYVEFYYNMKTGVVVQDYSKYIGHWWFLPSNNYNNYAYYNNAAYKINVKSINFVTGDIDLTAFVEGNGINGGSYPNYGKVTNTTINFKGKLKVYNYAAYTAGL